MAFKMAKGSLFAVLLRSSWWYSVSIGLFILVVSLALTDAKYAVLSVTASLPFLIIGAIACYKQLQQPSQKQVLDVVQQAKKMSAGIISEKIAANYIKRGYESSAFKGNGADLELTYGSRKLLLCSKRFKAANTGIEPLKLLVAAGQNIEATGFLYVTLGEISDAARNYAQEHNIELVESSRLATLFDGKAKIS
ncbi:restriction endonuclease [Aliamphritea ceti]|uniref:restriction endonuclease n=1 Tax=Aliamphritea ceti TaxID=1524258 RepID=UPI0021C27B6D|nr:restriction endonuclease [Aliamphritea ceti]